MYALTCFLLVSGKGNTGISSHLNLMRLRHFNGAKILTSDTRQENTQCLAQLTALLSLSGLVSVKIFTFSPSWR